MQAVTKIDMTQWPAPILRLFLGELSPVSLLASANDVESNSMDDKMCEAKFYSAIIALRQRREENARMLYQVVTDRWSPSSD
jgi:lipoprotein NlpI